MIIFFVIILQTPFAQVDMPLHLKLLFTCLLLLSILSNDHIGAQELGRLETNEAKAHQNNQRHQTNEQTNDELSWRPFPDVKELIDQGKIQDAIQRFTSYQAQHEDDPSYFNMLGVLYLKNKQYAQAASAFERVVLMQSDNAGAWLDLAIANAQAGNYEMATSYFEYINASLSPPPKVRTLILGYQQKMKRAQRLLAPWQYSAEMILGYDTNANSGLLNNQIRVTYQGTEIDLNLDKNYQPRADAYRQLIINTRYQGVWSGKRLDFYMGAQQRAFFKEHAYSFLDINSNVNLQTSTSYGDIGVAMGAQQFILANKTLLHNVTMTLNSERNMGDCRMNYAIETEIRRYKQATSLDGNVVWMQIANTCVFPAWHIPVQTNIVIKKGADHPVGFRAGGKTNRSELMAMLSVSMARQMRLDVNMNLSKANDSEGYSILLDNNAIRETWRRSIRMQLNIPISDEGMLTMGVEKNAIQSNLSLFRQKSQVFNMGYQKNF